MGEELVEALGAARGLVAGPAPLADTLSQIARLAVGVLAADVAGLTLVYPDGRARTAVSTGEAATEIDQAQYDADRGPCLHAFRNTTTVRVEDTRTEQRWPEFAAAATAHDIASTLSLPLLVGNEGIGALNLYSARPANFHSDDEEPGELLAAQAAVALTNAHAYREQAARAEQLAWALESRAVIEQAKGVIMASTGVTADEAFDLLRLQSQTENRKLRQVAAEIVELQHRKPKPA